MTGPDFKRIRRELGLSTEDWALALAVKDASYIRSMECGSKPITLVRARLAQMFGWHGVPSKWINEASPPSKP